MIQFRVRNNIVTATIVKGSGIGIDWSNKGNVVVVNNDFPVKGKADLAWNIFKKYELGLSFFKRLELSVCVLEN